MSSASNLLSGNASAEPVARMPSRTSPRFFSSICAIKRVSPVIASVSNFFPGCATSPTSTLRAMMRASAGATMLVCSSFALTICSAAWASFTLAAVACASAPPRVFAVACAVACWNAARALAAARSTSCSLASPMKPLACSALVRSKSAFAYSMFARLCASACEATGPASSNCDFRRASAVTIAACACACCARRSSSSSAIRRCPAFTESPSRTRTFSTRAVSVAARSVRATLDTRDEKTSEC